jgi:hypothetical protein
MEWKKVKFMERRIGEDFDGLIISVTKFGFFVELTDLFVEGLVPLNTLDSGRRPLHLSRKHPPDHRPALAQNLQPRGSHPRAGRPHRSGGEEDSVRGDRRAAKTCDPKEAQMNV